MSTTAGATLLEGAYRYCPTCATPLALITRTEDGGEVQRIRCPACDWTHWNLSLIHI